VLRIPPYLHAVRCRDEPQCFDFAFYRQTSSGVNTFLCERGVTGMWQGWRVKRITVALLTAPLLALAQSPVGLAPMTLFALVPWLWATRRAGPTEAIWLGALVGTLYGSLTSLWIPEALRSLGSSTQAATTVLLLTSAWAKAPLFAAASWLAQRLRERPAGEQIAGIALVFGVGEWALGSGRLGLPWAFVGHSQLTVPGAAQLAAVGGVPLLSAWLVAINAAIALAIAGGTNSRRTAIALLGSWLAAAWLGLPVAQWARPQDPQARSAELLVVQPELARSARWDRGAQAWILERVASQTSEALAAQERPPDAIVWPENLLTTPLEAAPELARTLQEHVDRWGVPLITGLVRPSLRRSPRQYRSSVVWIEPGEGIAAAMDKFLAVPVVESGRGFGDLISALFGRAARWPKVEEAAAPGGSLALRFSLTPALCYEVLFPQVVAARRSPESLAILNLADDSWVTGKRVSRQLADFAAFRAIEQRLTLIRVAHGGLSRVVDEFGRTRLELPADQWAQATVTVRASPPPTVFERAALIALPLSTGAGVWWALATGSQALARRRGSPGTKEALR
jgi:apolipoprotein N-acyltransferase